MQPPPRGPHFPQQPRSLSEREGQLTEKRGAGSPFSVLTRVYLLTPPPITGIERDDVAPFGFLLDKVSSLK